MTGLSKPHQRRQGPDLSPLLLLVRTPSAIRPELASRRAERSLPYLYVAIYFLIYMYNIYYLCCLCIEFITSLLGLAVGLLSI